MSERNASEKEIDVLPVFQTKNERKAYYNKIAPFYDLLAERSERAMREAGLAKLAALPGERLLEIGFGTGHCLVELARAVGPQGKVYGIDLSENMLAKAQDLLREENLQGRAELLCGDAEHLPYADGTMDGIFVSFALELFDTSEIPCVLAECRRVLRPGGRLVVVGMSKEGKAGLMSRTFEWTHQHFPNLLDCRPIYVRRALEAADFRIVDAEVEKMWVPVEIVKAVKEDG
jgi:demethylmenaquinone methyltransferase/2-methoxy-6-polyprenyl-1,4-benzoquinol methylase